MLVPAPMQLTDLTTYVDQGDLATSTDATSGFYHWSLHPDHWQYAGICVDGEYYVFTVPAFGLVRCCLRDRQS